MKKSKVLVYIILAIAFVLFNVIAFVIPTVKTATVWISYTFTVVAFLMQIVIWNIALKKDNLKSKFLGVSTIYVGIVYIILQLISFAVFNAYPLLAEWIAIVISVAILGISSICLISTEIAIGEIQKVDKKIESKTLYIKEVYTDVKLLADGEQEKEIKYVLEKLADKIKFSDPMSNEAVSAIEDEIRNKVNALKDAQDKMVLAREIESLLNERNSKVKILK